MNLNLCSLVKKSPSELVLIMSLLWAVSAVSGSAPSFVGIYVHSSWEPNQDPKKGLEPGTRLGTLTHPR